MSKHLIFFNKSTDIVNNKIAGRDIKDSYIFLYDTKTWKIVGENGVLSDTVEPTVDDNNIGNVNIDSLPSTNLGQKTNASSLSVTPATDINDGTYVGDIKFGESLPIGNKHIGQTGYTLKKISQSFNRPTDTNYYDVGDAITNSLVAPTPFQFDLGSIGVEAGQSIEIRKITVVSSVKQSTLPYINVYLSTTTFSATNDNQPLSIDDTTTENGGAWFICEEQNSTENNSEVAKSNANCPMTLAQNDTKLFGTLQAANTYTPVPDEKFTIIIWVALL